MVLKGGASSLTLTVDCTGFTLKPVGFFDRNPALDVPPGGGDHCDANGPDGVVHGPGKERVPDEKE